MYKKKQDMAIHTPIHIHAATHFCCIQACSCTHTKTYIPPVCMQENTYINACTYTIYMHVYLHNRYHILFFLLSPQDLMDKLYISSLTSCDICLNIVEYSALITYIHLPLSDYPLRTSDSFCISLVQFVY